MRRRFLNSSKFDYNNYMTIEPLEDITIYFSSDGFKYTSDGVKWNIVPMHTRIKLSKDKLYSFKRILMPEEELGKISVEGLHNLKGNCLSLIFGDNAKGETDISGYYRVFGHLFGFNTGLINVSKDFLPATTLAGFCYDSMFSFCTSLINAPDLPATTLAYYCYANMFDGCSKLNYIKMLATDISASSCLDNWVKGVASSGTFVKNPNATWDVYGNSGIPTGWKVVMDGEEESQDWTFEWNIIPDWEDGDPDCRESFMSGDFSEQVAFFDKMAKSIGEVSEYGNWKEYIIYGIPKECKISIEGEILSGADMTSIYYWGEFVNILITLNTEGRYTQIDMSNDFIAILSRKD